LAYCAQNISGSCIIITRRVIVRLTLNRVVVIKIDWRNKIDTVDVIVIGRCNRCH
jgi:hypothetical protein